jgi:hypothetical protein
LSKRCHVVSTPHPSGVTIPSPVTTTRLIVWLLPEAGVRACSSADQRSSVRDHARSL